MSSSTETRHPQPPAATQAESHEPSSLQGLAKLALGALGVVYGDIGTSPLYALKECFAPGHGLPLSTTNLLGVLSLVFWSLTWVIVFKYLSFVMKADNRGEGGILSLVALLTGRDGKPGRGTTGLVMLALAGASLLYGEGIITPAISVLSAVEGLSVATDFFTPFVVPITVAILVGLFAVQKRGTAGVGAIFGPLTLIWFGTLVVIGVPWIVQRPEVLAAVNPLYAFEFLRDGGMHAYLSLGSIVLCITGAEALYADMGHFGRRPIRVAWYFVVFPALLTNYFGQGALLLDRGAEAIGHPFYALVSGWQVYPLILIATIATIIASQALISGAYSLTHQAVQLGYMPRVSVVHTSGEHEGQIYIPEVNIALAIACIALVFAFRTSSGLAAAYGIAVTGTMSVTSILFFAVMRRRIGLVPSIVLLVLFLTVDLAFFGANLAKIAHGGWVPIVLGFVVFVVMTTWKRGRTELGRCVRDLTLPLEPFLEEIEAKGTHRVPGTAIFMTSNADGLPLALRHHYEHNQVLHEEVVLLTVVVEHVPAVPRRKRVQVRRLGAGFFHVVAHYGFRQSPRIAGILRECREAGLDADMKHTSFYLGRETLLKDGLSGMSKLRKWLFAFISRNARPATAYFQIPPDRVVELGVQIRL